MAKTTTSQNLNDMRSKFPGYYKPTENEFKDLWETAIFVLDANVLLDLFRYSDETVKILINTIIALKERIWIPYRVSLEYHRNLNDVINSQISSYNKTIDILEEFKKQLDAKRSHPFLKAPLHEEIKSFCSKFDSELTKKKSEVESLIIDNPIKEKIAELLDDKVGDNLSQSEIDKICQEGSKRYSEKIPPGYMDNKGKQGLDAYGDLLIWKEIISKSKSDSKHIILVTGDVKEDWFLKHLGKTISPRPELVHEFRMETKKLFYAYPTNQFLEFSNKYFNSNINIAVIEEVEKILATEEKKAQTSNTSNTTSSQENSTTSQPNSGEVKAKEISNSPIDQNQLKQSI